MDSSLPKCLNCQYFKPKAFMANKCDEVFFHMACILKTLTNPNFNPYFPISF